MGNSHSSVERFSLNDSSEVVWRKTKSQKEREVADTWIAEYSLARKRCVLSFTRTNRTQQHQEQVTISIEDRLPTYANDDVQVKMDVSIVEGLLSGTIALDGPSSIQQLPLCKTPFPQGAVSKSSSFLYGRDSDRKGLIVILTAKTHDDDKKLPYMITFKHYFVAANCSQGVYVAAKIRTNSGGGGLIFELEKPVAQSKRVLQSLFDDVKAKGWKPNPNGSEFAISELSNDQNKGKVPVSKNTNHDQNEGKVPVIKNTNHDQNEGKVPVIKNINHANADFFSYSISGYQNVSSIVSTSGYNNGDYNGAIILNNCQVMLLNSHKSTENQSEHEMWSNLFVLGRKS